MMLRLEKSGASWVVVIHRGYQFETRGTWDDLAFAAYVAMNFADMMGAGSPEIGEAVPPEAIALGLRLRQTLR